MAGSSDQKKQPVRLSLFRTGSLVATPGALAALEMAGVSPIDLITRHAHGDWGALCEEDRSANQFAVKFGGRVFSSYEIGTGVNATKVWCITEADRSSSCLLLPEEY